MKKQQTPYLCHIFVCANMRENNPENPGCGAKGGDVLKDKLKAAVTARGWKGKVRVTRAITGQTLLAGRPLVPQTTSTPAAAL